MIRVRAARIVRQVRSSHSPRRRSSIGLAALVALLAAPAAIAPSAAFALEADEIGVFPTWAVTGSSGVFSAVPTLPSSAGFPATVLTSTGTSLASPTGVSAFLGASTGFGAEFGSTRSQPYLSLSPAAGSTASVTTLSFDAAPPAGWGFALGDIDADWAFIRAFAGPGLTNPVALADLGYQGGGNYCTNSPRPSTCGAAPYTDAPVWVTAAETFDGIDYVPGTLRGNSLPGAPAPTRDTSGAYGWFVPAAPVQTLEITFGIRDGFPTAQFWLAAPAPKVVISGTVIVEGAPVGAAAPAGTAVQILDAEGSPLLDLTEQPLSVPVDPVTGQYTVELEQATEGYQAAVVPPSGFSAPPPVAIPGLPAVPGTTAAIAPPIVIAPLDDAVDPVDPVEPVTPAAPDGAAAPTLAHSGPAPMMLPAAGALAALLLGGLLTAMRQRAAHPPRARNR